MVDWYVETSRREAVLAVEAEIGAYLRRHADDPDTVADAEIAVSELIGNVTRHAGGPAWVSLRWTGRHPELTDVTVVLEERIAVGDPGCRLAVLLGSTSDNSEIGHRYRAPAGEAVGNR